MIEPKQIMQGKEDAPYLIFTGDFCPFDKALTAHLKIGTLLRASFDAATGVIVNLECPITDASTPIKKRGPSLKADRSVTRKMREIGITHCNLANNHIKDFGAKGILDTLDTLNEWGFGHFGLAGSGDEILIEEINGFRIALVSFTENEFSTGLSGGVGAVGMDFTKQQQQISTLRNQVDHIIVQYHGGVEMYHYPTPSQQKYCRFLIDIGASIVICHHSHCISGVEEYKGKKIYYGLGNFFFPEQGNQSIWYHGAVLKLTIDTAFRDELAYVSYDIRENLLDLEPRGAQQELVAGINAVITDPIELQIKWDAYCLTNRLRTQRAILKPGIVMRQLIKLGFLRRYLDNKMDMALLNTLRCESHYNRLLNTVRLLVEKEK